MNNHTEMEKRVNFSSLRTGHTHEKVEVSELSNLESIELKTRKSSRLSCRIMQAIALNRRYFRPTWCSLLDLACFCVRRGLCLFPWISHLTYLLNREQVTLQQRLLSEISGGDCGLLFSDVFFPFLSKYRTYIQE